MDLDESGYVRSAHSYHMLAKSHMGACRCNMISLPALSHQ